MYTGEGNYCSMKFLYKSISHFIKSRIRISNKDLMDFKQIRRGR